MTSKIYRKTANLSLIAFMALTGWLNLRTVVRRDVQGPPEALPQLTMRLEGAISAARRSETAPAPRLGLPPSIASRPALPLISEVLGAVRPGSDLPTHLVEAVTGQVEAGSDRPPCLVRAIEGFVEPGSDEEEADLLAATPSSAFGPGEEITVQLPIPLASAGTLGDVPSSKPAPASDAVTPGRSAANTVSVEAVALREVLFSCRADEWVFHCKFGGVVDWRSEWQAAHRTLTIRFDPVDESCRAEMFPPLQWVARIDREMEGRSCRLQFEIRPGVEPARALWNGRGQGERVDLPFAGRAAVVTVAEARAGRAELRKIDTEALHDGIELQQHRWVSRKGAGSDVQVAELDLSRRSFDLGLALAKGTILGRGTCSAMAHAEKALLAINASFFAGNGEPLGLVAKGDELLSVPIQRRACFGIFDGNRVLMGNPSFSGRLRTPQGTFFLDGVNQRRHAGKLVLYTPEFGRTTGSRSDGLELSVTDGRIVSIQSSNSVIPPRGYVVATEGNWPKKMESLAFWDSVDLDIGLTPPWDRGSFAIGGGPRLVREGNISVEWRQEGFKKDFATALAPRSAVGLRPDGRLLLVTVDGRRPPTSTGVSLDEMAEILLRLGCVEGLNLDGGGSTTFWAKGTLRNRPSDGRERAVSSALIVVPRRSFAASSSTDSGPRAL